jgi:hypothetical protein
MSPTEYFHGVEPLARKEREAFTRVKNAAMQYSIDSLLASKRREPTPAPAQVRDAVMAYQKILDEIVTLNRQFLA